MSETSEIQSPASNPQQHVVRKWWPRISVAIAVVLACSYMAFRYRIAEMDPLFRGNSFSTRLGLAQYLMGDYSAAAANLMKQELGRSSEERFPGALGLLQGNLDAAQAEVDAALARQPLDQSAQMSAAQIALERGDNVKAHTLATAYINGKAFAPFNARLIAGIAAARLKNYADASAHFSAATRMGHRGTRNTIMLSMLDSFGKLKAAGAFAQDPALGAVMLRVLAFCDPKLLATAEKYARTAISMDNRADDAWLVIGAAHFVGRRYGQALVATENASAINPKNPDAPWLAAYVHSARGDLAKEIPAVMAAFSLAPTDEFIADDTMRVLSKKVGDYPKIAALGKAMLTANSEANSDSSSDGVAKKPQGASSRTHTWIAHAATSLGQHREALGHNLAAQALVPLDTDVAMRLARSYLEVGDDANAITQAQAAIRLHSRWNAPFELIGDVHFKRGNYIDAIAAYEEGFGRQRPSVRQLTGLCVAYLRGSRYADASQCIESALRQDPDNVLASRLLYEVTLNRDIENNAKKSQGVTK